MQKTDIAIIGAGTAGMSAAIYAKRAGKNVVMLEGYMPGGQIVVTPEVDNYPALGKVSGYDFAMGLYNQATELGTEMISAEVNKYLVPTRYSRFAEGFNKDDESTWQMSTDQYNSISSLKGIGLSFCDAPGGFAEEMKEINWAVGLEYAYNEQFFGRVGYYNEAYEKGNRKYFTVGAGFKLSAFKLDVGYVISVAQTNPLDQTLRFSLGFDIDGLKALADRE